MAYALKIQRRGKRTTYDDEYMNQLTVNNYIKIKENGYLSVSGNTILNTLTTLSDTSLGGNVYINNDLSIGGIFVCR